MICPKCNIEPKPILYDSDAGSMIFRPCGLLNENQVATMDIEQCPMTAWQKGYADCISDSKKELADASGKISKQGHYTIDAESFDKLVEDLQSDKEPSEQVKKAREKFLQIKKESGDER